MVDFPHMNAPDRKLSDSRRRFRWASRKAMWAVSLALIVAALVALDRAGWFGQLVPPDRERYDGQIFRVLRVIDGDTLDLDAPDAVRNESHTRVRLWGVDTPETKKPHTPSQHFGPEATDFTRRLTLDQDVRIELEPDKWPRDKYDRLLAFVYLPDGRMLNRELISQGYGYADPRFDHHLRGEFRGLQIEAKAARRGLWKDVSKTDLPYYYRDKLKLP
ncbi:MAG TPA: hypothetical protein DCX07_02300 [Phycisphaerales bacterium]|nr:hypothetical protein [Phycisphaerales bacterium]